MRSNSRRSSGGPRRAFILVEVMMAIMVFSMVAVGLARALGMAADSVHRSSRERQVRLGLESRLAEAQVLPVVMGVQAENPDPSGIVYETEWESIQPVNEEQTVLPGLYQLTVRAKWIDRTVPDSETATVAVYRPQS
jgi:hypothetical protein